MDCLRRSTEPCSHSQDARHDGSFFKPIPRLRAIAHACAGGLLLCLLGQDASAADVLVVTDSRHPVQSASGARVIELDLPERIEAELAAGLPADPAARPRSCSSVARWRPGAAAPHRQRLSGRRRCLGLGLAKVPAVVVDRRYVVYGEPDVARAPGPHRIPSEGTAMNRLLSASLAPGPPRHRLGAAPAAPLRASR